MIIYYLDGYLRTVVAQVCDCKCNWLWVLSLLEEMKYLLKFVVSRQNEALNFITQHPSLENLAENGGRSVFIIYSNYIFLCSYIPLSIRQVMEQ